MSSSGDLLRRGQRGFDRGIRLNIERTYRRCALELRAIRKVQNEANSQQLAEKKFERLLKKMLDSAPPGYEFQPKLVPINQNCAPTTTPSSPTPRLPFPQPQTAAASPRSE